MYSDVGLNLEKNYMKYWPDCGMNVYYLTNTNQINFQKFTGLTAGTDYGWSDALAVSLEKISEDYVWLMLEDCFFTKEVNNQIVNKAMTATVISNTLDTCFNETNNGLGNLLFVFLF
jgi:hypothetical protein